MSETDFINGLIVKAPHDNAPDFVKAKLSLKREEVIASLQALEGEWVNLDVKVAKSGKWVATIDHWKPNQGSERQERPRATASTHGSSAAAEAANAADDDIPF